MEEFEINKIWKLYFSQADFKKIKRKPKKIKKDKKVEKMV